MSLILAIASIAICAAANGSCSGNIDLGAAVGLLAGLWTSLFVLLLLQVIGYVGLIKSYPKVMFVYYFFVCGVMFVCQMMLFGSFQGTANTCMTSAPVQYWFTIINVTIFYLMVVFGLATWGFYLCKVADAEEELIATAVKMHLYK